MRIPENKSDIESFEDFDLNFLIEHPEILTWLQDYNWPIAKELSRIIRPYVLELEDPILKILKSDDLEWKSNVIGAVIYYSEEISETLISELKKLYTSARELEEIKEECEEVFKKFCIEY